MRNKIKSLPDAIKLRESARAAGRTVVFTNGCFDLLHAGHVDYLEAAAREGDLLIVGLNDDDSVRRIKGPERPLTPAADRAAVLAGLGAVAAVVVFGEDDPGWLIAALVPDVLVKGADWAEGEIIGADTVKAAGGRVVRVPLTAGRSTSALIRTVVEKYGGGKVPTLNRSSP
jgi:D-beta-D-heptose 7-phosphate kinase/D-beta-D-heptose 1-phosphate adenosyltransferase